MNLIIDIRIATKYSGGALTYLKGMLKELLKQEEYKIYLIGTNNNFEIINDLKGNYSKIFTPTNSTSPYLKFVDDLFLYRAINKIKGGKIYWEPFNIGIPYFLKVNLIISTIHDFLVFDCPECVKFPKNIYRRIGLKRTVKLSNAIITVSKFTKERLQLIFKKKLKNKRIIFSYEGVDIIPSSMWEPYDSLNIRNMNYLLFVGVNRKNKNLDFLLDVFFVLKTKYKYTGKLIIVGNSNKKFKDKLNAKINDLTLVKEVILTGFVADRQLPLLYHNADAFLFPSYYEGFGLPAIEASAYGTKVCCSDFNSLNEIAQDFAETANPFDVNEFASKTNELLNSKLVKKVNQTKFSWSNAVNDLIKLINHETNHTRPKKRQQ